MKSKVFDLIEEEKKRQSETLMMIPSENYTYPEVREAVGSILIHKYAEGQPAKRYYQGNSVVDQVEKYAEEVALSAFGLTANKWGVNVQPYSGCPANLAVYNALLSPGDKILAMFLPDGGHLSHGWSLPGKKVTLVSKIWEVEFYRVDPKTEVFNYGLLEEQAQRFKPKMLISGGTAYPREINHQRMGEIARKVGAYYLADVAHEAGLIAGGANQSPFPFADVVTMTTHKTLRGPRGAIIFSRKELADKIDESIFPGLQGGPHLHTIAGIAIALEKTKTAEFKNYARQTVINARKVAEELTKKGYRVVSSGTDKHLVLVDLRPKNLNGWFAAWGLEEAGIIVNRNTVPGENGLPYYPSGIRLGAPALTVRGMKEKEMAQIVEWIDQVLVHLGSRTVPEEKEKRNKTLKEFKGEISKDSFLKEIKNQVKEFCKSYPIPLK